MALDRGRVGKAEAPAAAEEDEEAPDGPAALPQDSLRDWEERLDWAVEDLSLRTRAVFFAAWGTAGCGTEEVT